jgi:flagellar biosynthesis protein FlhF
VIRARLKVLAVANGQRVPEDWHRLSAAALVQRALKAQGGSAWRLDSGDVGLIFAGLPEGAGADAVCAAARTDTARAAARTDAARAAARSDAAPAAARI